MKKLLISLFLLTSLAFAQQSMYFHIKLIDQENGRGIPLVQLKTVHDVCYYSDSAGNIAFYEPGFMDKKIFFHIASHGYEYPQDGFGYRGIALRTTPGTKVEIPLKRTTIAKRIYRVTGQGIYRDSHILQQDIPIQNGLLNGQVIGQDTVMMTPYQGKLFWFWGDTNRPQYPLGNFAVTGAFSELPSKGGLSPQQGINFNYFVDTDGFVKKMCPIPGPGPVWIEGLMVIKQNGKETLLAQYERIQNLTAIYERGLVIFNDEKKLFEKKMSWDLNKKVYPRGHPIRATSQGKEYFYFSHPHPSPFPNVRVPINFDQISNPDSYEVFSCFPENHLYKKPSAISHNKAQYSWKKQSIPLSTRVQQDMIDKKILSSENAWLAITDIETGDAIQIHAGSVVWNPYRQKWVAIVEQGEFKLGEIWYLEADTITGPWVFAQKIATHHPMILYNPKQHSVFAEKNGQIIYWEGTYANTFTNEQPVPYYNYNQIMYQTDLGNPKLCLPCPVYKLETGAVLFAEEIRRQGYETKAKKIVFWALPKNRASQNQIPIYRDAKNNFYPHPASDRKLLGYGLPPNTTMPKKLLMPLKIQDEIFCFVWHNPLKNFSGDWQTLPVESVH